MLSKLLRSARSLLNHTPEPESSIQLPATADDEVMVTTRKQAGSQDTNLDESPSSISKRLTRSAAKEVDEGLEEKEALPVRMKDASKTPSKSIVDVVIPVSRLPEEILDSKSDGPTIHEIVEIADSEESEGENERPAGKAMEESKLQEDDATENLDMITAGKNQDPIDGSNKIQRSEMKASKSTNQETGNAEKNLKDGLPGLATPTKERRASRKTKGSTPGAPIVSSPMTLAMPTPTPKKSTMSKTTPVATPEASNHKRFDSEEPEVEILSTAPVVVDMDEADSDDDSDDAPEEFNKASAAKVHEEQERDASNAIEM